MMRVAALLLCVVSVMGDGVTYLPTLKVMEGHMDLWCDFFKNGTEVPLLNSFTPDARVCFNGQCGNREGLLQFKSDHFTKFSVTIDDRSVYQKNTFHMRWSNGIETPHCSGPLSGYYAGYLNSGGKVTEVHVWYPEDVFNKFYTKECGGPR